MKFFKTFFFKKNANFFYKKKSKFRKTMPPKKMTPREKRLQRRNKYIVIQKTKKRRQTQTITLRNGIFSDADTMFRWSGCTAFAKQRMNENPLMFNYVFSKAFLNYTTYIQNLHQKHF